MKSPKSMPIRPVNDILPEDNIDLNFFHAIEMLIINKILVRVGQRTGVAYKFHKKRQFKVIYQSCEDLFKNFKQRLSKETIQEIIDDILSSPCFLEVLKDVYLTGTAEEKEKIIQEIDFEELNKKIYALVTSYLIRKGCLKRGKGFGTL